MRKVLFYLSLLWAAAAFAYAFYERSAEIGLYAKLLGWQLETFGSAPINITTMVVGLIYGLPGLVTLSLTRHARGPADPVAGRRNAALLFLVFGVILILAGVGGYVLSMNHAARQLAGEETARAPRLVPFDLDNANAVPNAGDADGVILTGWLRRDAQYALEEKGYVGKKTVFCPVVGQRWKASEPVRVFLRADPTAPIALHDAGGPEGMRLPRGFVPVDFAPATPLRVTIEGTLRRGGLPDYAASFFDKQGVEAAADYVLLEAKPFYGRARRSEWEKFAATSHLLAYLTVPLGLVMFVLSLISFMRWRKLAAQGETPYLHR